MRILKQLLLFVSLCAATLAGYAAEVTLVVVETPAFEGVAPEIQKDLAEKGVRISGEDGPLYEFVLCKSIPLKGNPESPNEALKQLAQGTLLGIMKVHEAERDYRDDEIGAGTYTMRFALQPQNGDHLGTSEFPFYALLIPVERDTTVEGIEGYEAVTEASKEDTATEHPIIVSLRPSDKSEITTPEIREPLEEHKSVLLSAPAKLPDGTDTVLAFELVFEGTGEL